MAIKLCVIAAACENMGIGYKNDLPWRLKKEMAYFNRMTCAQSPNSGKVNAVLMGRRTWESIPPKYRPLPNRLNIVLSGTSDAKTLGIDENVLLFSNWDQVIQAFSEEKHENIDNVWVIGGSAIYKMAMDSPHCHRIYLTRILKDFECDTFFPEFDTSKFQPVTDPEVPQEEQEENGIKYRFEVYERIK